MEAFTATEGVLQLVTFTLGSEEYAIDILRVQEINRMSSITMVPNSPQYVEGVINLRGKVIPVINLRKKFEIPEKESDSSSRIMILEIRGATIGIIVDSVSEVLRVASNIVEPPPPMSTNIAADFIKGIAKLEDRLIILLDIDKLISNSEESGFF
ncbi:MAG: chemotaxis protein CheW [Candidatus Magnetoovum sp. WYHC-5]|nr:chemotaxis protein CheW [Candidatus Magnetoovum sp. WYHC-5]